VDLTPELTAQLGYSGSGVLVSDVELNSPADTAQLARGDVIVAIAGQRIADVSSVSAVRQQLDLRQPVSMQIWRRGTTSSVTLWAQSGPSRG
jgi:S1-C subfamily serine protease